MPTLLMMENAGRSSAELLLSFQPTGRIVILCGKGNNGGDGFVIARHLHNAGAEIQVLFFGEPSQVQGDAKINLEIAQRAGLPIRIDSGEGVIADEMESAEWIVDALFGIGLTGTLRAPFDRIVTEVNQANKRVLAIDVPSGLNADTGTVHGAAIQAERTITFIARKPGLICEQAKPWVGDLHSADAGLPRAWLHSSAQPPA